MIQNKLHYTNKLKILSPHIILIPGFRTLTLSTLETPRRSPLTDLHNAVVTALEEQTFWCLYSGDWTSKEESEF